MAEGQNLAQFLMEGPANVITPTKFAEVAAKSWENCQMSTFESRMISSQQK